MLFVKQTFSRFCSICDNISKVNVMLVELQRSSKCKRGVIFVAVGEKWSQLSVKLSFRRRGVLGCKESDEMLEID